MTIISQISRGSGDAFARLVEGLQQEFGCADVQALAGRIFDAEKADFLWEARVSEHYLGQHFPLDQASDEGVDDFCRMAILSEFGGRWHAGVCVVDGECCAVEMLWVRSFDRCNDAADAFTRAR